MIFVVIHWLERLGMHVPAAFAYSSTRMALAAITSLFLCVLFGPRFIRKLYALKIGQPIRMEEAPKLGQLHKNKANTPTMGGILMLASMLVAMLLWMDVSHAFTLILLLTTIWLGCVGAFDDYCKLRQKSSKGLSARWKFGLQFLFCLGLTVYLVAPSAPGWLAHVSWVDVPFAKEASGEGMQTLSLSQYVTRLYIPFVKQPLFSFAGWGLIIFALFLVFVVAGTSNAVNLTDGLDGLAVGLLALTASALAAVAFLSNHLELARYLNILYIDGSGEIAVYLAAFVGACLGFLWYNGHPAQVFMGDTGSLALGGVLGVSAILLGRELLLALVGGVFVVETLSVIIQVASFRLRGGKRVFLIAPLHHHFEYKGWPETKVVVRFWIVGLLLAIVGVATLKFQ